MSVASHPRLLAFHLIVALIATTGLAAADASRLDAATRRLLADPSAPSRVGVIITARRGAAVRERLMRRGARLAAEIPLLGSFAATVDTAELSALAADPDVAHVSLDAPVRSAAAGHDVTASLSSPLLQTLADASPYTGRDVGIAVIDSGIRTSGDLIPAAAFDFTGAEVRRGGDDEYGHGTHVAGLIAAAGRHATAVRGLAPGVRLVSLKVLDRRGEGVTSSVIAAIEFAVENRRRLGIDILNLSLGHPSLEPAATDPLVQAVEAATRTGLIVIVAAGNVGVRPDGVPLYGGVLSPGNAPSAITVGATDARATADRGDDTVAPYSSRGPTRFDAMAKPDVVAPGHRLVSLAVPGSWLFEQRPALRVADREGLPRYFRLSGTSMAAGVTSAAVARLVEAARATRQLPLTANRAKALLQFTALAIPGDDVLTRGAGSLNVAGAISVLSAAVPPAATRVAGTLHPWSQRLVWGNALLAADTLGQAERAWASAVVWGSDVSWEVTPIVPVDPDVVDDLAHLWAGGADGTSAAAADTIVWGNAKDTIVWGNAKDTIVWGNAADTIVWGNSSGWEDVFVE